MKVAVIKKLPTVAAVILLTASLVLVWANQAFADSKPYFEAREGDVFAGGWFENSTGQCLTSDATYEAPDFGSLTTTKYKGAIMGFATVGGSGRTGANANLGGFGLGLIEGSPSSSSSNYGFFSGLSGTGALNFSNNDSHSQGSAFWGGLFNGSGAEVAHCIPDYWSKQSSPPAATSASSFNLGAADGKYLLGDTGSPRTISGGSIAAGKKLSYFVDGDVFITGNITYPTPPNANSATKFVMVVRGNIYIAPGVSRLDGWYIAQPGGTNEGQVWTCHDGNPANQKPADTWVRPNCNSTLTINGALTARRVNLLRIAGGLGGSAVNTRAEIINYTPEMVVGGPFFNAPPTQGEGLDSLISLPPVF